MILQELPTAAVNGKPSTVAIARQLARLVGAGWQAPQDSLNAADVLALASSLDDGRNELLEVLNQAFANTATSLLDELEQTYGVPNDALMGTPQRQERLTAVLRASISGSPQSIVSAVSQFGPAAVHECTIPATALDRFRFVVTVPLPFSLSPDAQRVRDVVDRMKPAYSSYTLATYFYFLTDGVNNSFCDQTALGV